MTVLAKSSVAMSSEIRLAHGHRIQEAVSSKRFRLIFRADYRIGNLSCLSYVALMSTWRHRCFIRHAFNVGYDFEYSQIGSLARRSVFYNQIQH